MEPGYIDLHKSGKLVNRAQALEQLLSYCCLCPRQCGTNRLAGEKGVCRTGSNAVVASYAPHFGEESPLVGSKGSGTIFLSHCNLRCVFCQNYDISHLGVGVEVTPEQLAAIMMSLQEQGCHNINFVTPTHVVPQIVAALPYGVDAGLSVPLVYNSSGYDSVDTLQLLDHIFDIYMPDFKFWDSASAKRYAKAEDYPARAREAIREMHKQVGELVIGADGVAVRGLLVRHLIMPDGLAETDRILHYLAEEISTETYVNVMDQYRPCGRAHLYPPLDRQLSHDQYQEALNLAKKAGLKRLARKDWGGLFRILELF
jgi:putative pyruvate formate lyase activating enzyme